ATRARVRAACWSQPPVREHGRGRRQAADAGCRRRLRRARPAGRRDLRTGHQRRSRPKERSETPGGPTYLIPSPGVDSGRATERNDRMTSIDNRFDEAEADVERGNPWRFREPDAPNPLTILATGWSTGHTKLGDAEFLNGTDRDGRKWSVLVGSVVLKKKLVEGLVEEWDDSVHKYVVVEELGKVEPNEIVSIKYLG